MKILFFTSWYPRPSQPYGGIFFRNQAEAILDEGHEVIIACVHIKFWLKIDKTGLDVQKKGNLTEYVWYIPSPVPRWNFLYSLLHRIFTRKLYKIIVRNHGKPDLIHAHCVFKAGYSVSFLTKAENLPMILTEHSSSVLVGNLNKKQIKQLQQTLTDATKVISVSEKLKDTLSPYTKDVEVIPNLVNTDLFGLKEHEVSCNEFRFISLCNLVRNKGLDLLIQAFAEEFRDDKHVTLSIGGSGEQRSRLEALSHRLNCAERVEFTGPIPHKDVPDFMSKGNCFVLPSKFETFGIVYIEAAASGLPLIGTRCGGPEEIIHNRNGLLIPVDDLESLKRAMRHMYDHEGKYDKAQIRNDIIERFGTKSVATRIIEVYRQSLLQGRIDS